MIASRESGNQRHSATGGLLDTLPRDRLHARAAMRIGVLARRAGANIQTIRFYERRRLLREAARTASGYRNYERGDLDSRAFIKWYQPLGFTLKEIRQLLRLHAAVASLPVGSRGRKLKKLEFIVRMGEERLASIEEKVRLLAGMKKQLRSVIQELRGRQALICLASSKSGVRNSSK
jgi:DNA-binding transcriptional MerR regulator